MIWTSRVVGFSIAAIIGLLFSTISVAIANAAEIKLIFDSANTQLIDLARESAPHGCVGTTCADGPRRDQA